tara:strand:- start:836 stop:1189 length:354 start_codon:yes stop_codon:yes gene_type:complete
MLPKYWLKFLESNQLIGMDIEISEGNDLSTLGADLRIMNEEQSQSEAADCYPGIVAIKKGYIPVAMCLGGSGDYYYLNTHEGAEGSLYRIYHDAVTGEELEEDGVEKVLQRFTSLLE